MIINTNTQNSSSFESLTPMQQAELITFVNGLIQGALAYKPQFTVSDIVGGQFRNWTYTPLQYIYEYHVKVGAAKPDAEAGKDIGRIIKYIMHLDKHRLYKITGSEQRRYPVNVYELVDIKD